MRESYPIFIIGAARSGTKILRDVISQHPEIEKVPYDINYIWRIGNEAAKNDELNANQASPEDIVEIRKRIKSIAPNAKFLIEKTVSNCLRISYVDAVFPEAKYIHIVRRGEDVIESSFRQWLAPPDFKYILKKSKTFPVRDAFRYGLSFAWKTFVRMMPSRHKVPGIWGPHYEGIEKDLNGKELLEVCAIQWLKCLEKATLDLCEQEAGRVFWLRYENFVEAPEHHLRRIAEFIGIDPSPYGFAGIIDFVQMGNIGKGGKNLTSQQQALIHPYVQQGEQLLESRVIAQIFASS